METRVLIRSYPKPNVVNPDLTQNLMLSIPHPNDAPDEIWLCGPLVSEIFMFESVDGRRLESHTIPSPWAFGSGELKRP